MVAGAFAFGANAGGAVEFEMDDAPLARGHRVESKCLPGFADSLRSDARGKLEFFEPGSAVITTIETHAVVQPRIEAQPAVRDVLKSQQKLRIAFEQQVPIVAAKRDDNICLATWA